MSSFPLSCILQPNVFFRQYIRDLPIDADHPHVQASLVSLRDVAISVACMLPFVPFSILVCPFAPQGPYGHVNLTASSLLVDQRVVFDLMLEQVPSNSSIIAISSFARSAGYLKAADAAYFEVADAVMPRRHMVPGLIDTKALAEFEDIRRSSLVASRALYRLLVQVELSLCR